MERGGQFPFETILVATDFSDTASVALRYAQAIAHWKKATLVLVHVIDPVGYAFPLGAPAAISTDEAARIELAQVEEKIRGQGIEVRSVIETGTICERILEAVQDHSASLLVLGTRAKTVAGRAALGTVARQLLVHSPCPILTVAPEAEAQLAWAGHWRNVLIATDFSPSSLAALTQAHNIAYRQLTVLHSTCCGNHHECSYCLERLRFLAPFNESHTVPVEHFVTSGDPAAEIKEFAARFHADLVVLGAPSIELSAADMESSTVLQVISGVHCPVMVVPAGQARCEAELIREVTFAC